MESRLFLAFAAGLLQYQRFELLLLTKKTQTVFCFFDSSLLHLVKAVFRCQKLSRNKVGLSDASYLERPLEGANVFGLQLKIFPHYGESGKRE